MNKDEDNDWFEIESNADGTKWHGIRNDKSAKRCRLVGDRVGEWRQIDH